MLLAGKAAAPHRACMRAAQVEAELKAGQCSLAFEALSPGRALLARMLAASAAWRERLELTRRAMHARRSTPAGDKEWALHDAFLQACDAADAGNPDFSIRAFFYRVRDAYWAEEVRRSACTLSLS